MKTNCRSDLAIHVGEFLEETLAETGITQNELADKLKQPLQLINEIIEGKKSITSAIALELEKTLNVPAHIWLGLENQYQATTGAQKDT